jgi:GMP synthase (glutamine-hydrolysing)
MKKTALAIRHVGFEDLGSLAGVLEVHDYHIQYREAGLDDLAALDPLASDLLVILGGPLGVHQAADYPFLASEVDIARRRIAAGRPTLGICLGSQIMARALGAEVRVAEQGEVGWAPLQLTTAGRTSPLAHLEGVSVLHWHWDRCELPAGAERLASTAACPNQAFRISTQVLALQFHPEVQWPEMERWLIGHTHTLVERGESIPRLRAESVRNCSALEPAVARMLADWLADLH